MPQTPALSFIIPHYEDHERLFECVASLASFKNIEIIIVDDASPSERCLPKGSNIRVISLSNNRGPAVCRNIGVTKAKGDYIMFVDSDDLICGRPDKILDFALKSWGFVDIVLCNMKDKMLPQPLLVNQGILQSFRENLFFAKLVHFSPHLYRREFLISSQCIFPVDLRLAEDILFLLHALSASDRLVVVDEATYQYRRRESSLSSRLYSLSDHYLLLEELPSRLISVLSGFPLHLQVRLMMAFPYRVRNAKCALMLNDVDEIRVFDALHKFVEFDTPNARATRKLAKIQWPPFASQVMKFLRNGDPAGLFSYLRKAEL